MSLMLQGRVQAVRTRQVPAGPTWESFEETTLVIADFGATHYVSVTRELRDSGLPGEGEEVLLEVGIRSYVRKDGTGAGHQLTAYRRADAGQSAGARAVKAV
jgi:hypothetical protein